MAIIFFFASELIYVIWTNFFIYIRLDNITASIFMILIYVILTVFLQLCSCQQYYCIDFHDIHVQYDQNINSPLFFKQKNVNLLD